jgi:hypothetical protein
MFKTAVAILAILSVLGLSVLGIDVGMLVPSEQARRIAAEGLASLGSTVSSTPLTAFAR